MIRFLLLVLLLGCSAFPSAWMKNRKGSSAYKDGKYTDAEKAYHDAEIESPEQKLLAYNRANALYKMGDYDGATKEYEKARVLPDAAMKKRILYNSANTLFKKGLTAKDGSGQASVEEAAKLYKEILKKEPTDFFSKFNLEKALQVIEQMKKNPQQDKKDQKQDQDKKNQDKQDQNKQNQENKQDDQNKQDQQKQEQKQDQGKEDNKEQKQQQQPKPKPGEMSEEEAKRLLDAMKQDENEKQKKLMMLRTRGRKLDKDW